MADKPKPGRPAETPIFTMLAKFEVFAECNVSARWVPKQLTEDEQASRVTLAKEHLGRLNYDENKFLNFIVTGDEMLVHYFHLKIKAHSKQWKRAGSPPLKKFKLSICW